MPSSSPVAGDPEEMQMLPEHPEVVRQSKRDSRKLLAETLWPSFMPVRGKKGRMDKILSKEDFLPNRGKKFLLRRLNSWLRAGQVPDSFSYPKRGKKTKSLPNSRPAADLMWLTKDDFFPHRGKKSDDDDGSFTSLFGNDLDDAAVEVGDYYVDVPAVVVATDNEEDGVIFGADRDWRSMGRQNRELLNNLSKQEPGDKWRGRKRSVQTDTDHYDNVQLSRQSLATAAALNEVISFDIYCH